MSLLQGQQTLLNILRSSLKNPPEVITVEVLDEMAELIEAKKEEIASKSSLSSSQLQLGIQEEEN